MTFVEIVPNLGANVEELHGSMLYITVVQKNTPASCTDTEIERGYRRRNHITSEEIVPNLGGYVEELHGGMPCMAVVQKNVN